MLAYLLLVVWTEDSEAFVLAPDGIPGSMRNRPFWNADPVCRDLDSTNPDAAGYLSALIDATAAWPIDRGAVFAMVTTAITWRTAWRETAPNVALAGFRGNLGGRGTAR